MGGGTTGYDPNYYGYGSGRGEYGRGADYGRGYDYDRGDWGFRTRGREGREREEGRGWWDRVTDEVSSWFGGGEDERRRGGQYRGRGPRGYRRSDSRIEEDINDRLSDHPYLDASDIEVSVENGEVKLSGTVNSRHEKRLAEDLAEMVSGVTHVENRIRVNRGGWGTATGSGMTAGATTGTTTGTAMGAAAGATGATGAASGTGTTGATGTTGTETTDTSRGRSRS